MTMMIRGRTALLATVAASGVALASAAAAATPVVKPAPVDEAAQDARIAKLEAAVAALQGQVAQDQQLQAENVALKGEVGQLEIQVSNLKAETIQQIDVVKQADANLPKVGFPNGRPTIASADGQFTMSLRGVAQLDTADYSQSAIGPTSTDLRRDGPALGSSGTNTDAAHARDLKDGTLWRRARIGIDGTAYGDWDYRLLFDFGGSGTEDAGQFYEGWAQYSGFKPFHIRAGAFSPPIGLEDQGSTNAMMFLERPGIADVARNLAAGDTRMAAGAFGYDNRWFLSADVTGRTIGVVNSGTFITSTTTGNVGTGQSYGDQLGFVGRGVVTPFLGKDWRINLGVHGSYVDHPADTAGPGTNGEIPITGYAVRLKDTPELRVDGTTFIDTGNIDANSASTVGVEAAGEWKSLFVQSEYESIHVGRSDAGVTQPTFSGWYLEGSWMLTGEHRVYNASTAAFDGPAVAHPFSLKGGAWGALELAVRYSDTDLNFDAGALGSAPSADAIRGGDQQVWSAGVNWYFNPVFRVMLDVDQVHIERLSPSATNFATPTGAEIGQTFTAVAVRTQAAF